MEKLTYVRELSTLEEARKSIEASLPPVLYKYRRWDDEFHRKGLIDAEIYFAHPKNLNDKFDIRIPVTRDYEEINDPRFFEKLKDVVSHFHPTLLRTSLEFLAICVDKMTEIRNDPEAYFEKNNQDIREGTLYDIYGVFSLTKDDCNPTMWAYYSNDNKGFCIGFEPAPIFIATRSSLGSATYRDEPIKESFFEPADHQGFLHDFIKSSKWSHEQEIRFITLFIRKKEDRVVKIDRRLVKEVLLGKDISEEDKEAIINVLKTNYNSAVKLFQMNDRPNGYNYSKTEIAY